MRRCGLCTASTGAVHLVPGCTESWSTGRSTGRGRVHCGARSAEPAESEAPPPRPDAWSDEVVAALAALDPGQRAVVVLRHLLEYTPGEIADLLDLPRGTVNSRLRRALDRLADELGGQR